MAVHMAVVDSYKYNGLLYFVMLLIYSKYIKPEYKYKSVCSVIALVLLSV